MVHVVVWNDGKSQVKFGYDEEPPSGPVPGGISYLTDQYYYPIDPDKRPEWLKRKLAEGIADLQKYGPDSYPAWLEDMINAGNTPAWLGDSAATPEMIAEAAAAREALPESKVDSIWDGQVVTTTFKFEEKMLNEFPFQPYARPTIPEDGTLDPSHFGLRVIGYQQDTPVSVTDFPLNIQMPDGGLSDQYFDKVSDFVYWVVETCRRTRFTETASHWTDAQRFEIAQAATKVGLELYADGSISIGGIATILDNAEQVVTQYLLRLKSLTDWAIETVDGVVLTDSQVAQLLPQDLFDVCSEDIIDFDFSTEIRVPKPIK
jgi:hypothetical protein